MYQVMALEDWMNLRMDELRQDIRKQQSELQQQQQQAQAEQQAANAGTAASNGPSRLTSDDVSPSDSAQPQSAAASARSRPQSAHTSGRVPNGPLSQAQIEQWFNVLSTCLHEIMRQVWTSSKDRATLLLRVWER